MTEQLNFAPYNLTKEQLETLLILQDPNIDPYLILEQYADQQIMDAKLKRSAFIEKLDGQLKTAIAKEHDWWFSIEGSFLTESGFLYWTQGNSPFAIMYQHYFNLLLYLIEHYDIDLDLLLTASRIKK